jgi:hypothetical protein
MRRLRPALAISIILGQGLPEFSLAAARPSLREVKLSTETLTSPASDETYVVSPSTPTPYQLRQMRKQRPLPPAMRQLRKMRQQIQRKIKKTSPNPRVQSPEFSPMPASAPVIPVLPPKPSQETVTERFFAGAAKVMTKSWNGNIFVWLPAISTDPNGGPTYGVLPVLVLADPATHNIRQLLAPSYTYNRLFGQTGTMRYYWYPTSSSQYVAIGSYSQHTNREAKVRYENPALMDGTLYFRSEAYYQADGSRRFFGLGPESREGNQSGYTSEETVVQAAAGLNFFKYWRATLGMRYRHEAIEDNIIPGIPDMQNEFPNTPGVNTHHTTAGEFRLLWDDRDLPITPSRGSSGEFFLEKTDHDLGSDSDFLRYGMEGKHFFLWENPNYVTVVHSLYEKANGSNIPFYELPSLGGRDTLRGYGDGRFADKGRLVFNVEHRMTVYTMEMMGIRSNFELAPFFDLGSVFPDIQDIKMKNFRPVYGGAFRAAVKPNVVGDVEVGVGQEGPAVFVDINYPY